jgi:hypothetical protein
MSIGLIIFHGALAATAFLAVLNGYLRGAAKAKIDGLLSVAWIGLLAAAFVFFGWRQGLLALVLSFAYAMAANPLAKAVARRMLGYRTTLGTTECEIDYSVDGLLRRSDETDRRLTRIASRPGIAEVLAVNELQADDLKEQLGFLMSSGLGDLSWEIVSTPSDLQLLLDLRGQGLEPIEIASRLTRAG